jgi:hypothetical protein
MCRIRVVLSAWQCPKLRREVWLRVETLHDMTKGSVKSRRFTCDNAYMCRKKGALHDDYSECIHPESDPFRHTGNRDT